jgi:hypothetical protein
MLQKTPHSINLIIHNSLCNILPGAALIMIQPVEMVSIDVTPLEELV